MTSTDAADTCSDLTAAKLREAKRILMQTDPYEGLTDWERGFLQGQAFSENVGWTERAAWFATGVIFCLFAGLIWHGIAGR